jgi:drug/metabolite transporter (DMT)-like permease
LLPWFRISFYLIKTFPNIMWPIYAAIAVLFMGFNAFIVKNLSKKTSPHAILFYQFILATPLVFTYLMIKGGEFNFSPWLLIMGFAYFLSLTLYYITLKKVGLTKAGPLWNLNLIVSAILGFIFLNEQINFKIAAGLMFGIISIFLIGGDKK